MATLFLGYCMHQQLQKITTHRFLENWMELLVWADVEKIHSQQRS